MRTIVVDIPFGISFALHTVVPGLLSIEYTTQNNATQHDASTPPPAHRPQWPAVHVMVVDIPPLPSPDPTEKAYNPDDQENQQEYCVEQLKLLGIPARDFAFEPYPNDQKAPEVFDPCIALFKYKYGVEMTARDVVRLMSLGWLTKEQVQSDISKEGWASLIESSNALEYPWVSLKMDPPTGNYDAIMTSLRRQISLTYHGTLNETTDARPDSDEVDGPEDDLDKLLRDSASVQFKRSRVQDDHATEEDDGRKLMYKRRKLSPHVSSRTPSPVPPVSSPDVIDPCSSSLPASGTSTMHSQTSRSRGLTRAKTLQHL